MLCFLTVSRREISGTPPSRYSTTGWNNVGGFPLMWSWIPFWLFSFVYFESMFHCCSVGMCQSRIPQNVALAFLKQTQTHVRTRVRFRGVGQFLMFPAPQCLRALPRCSLHAPGLACGREKARPRLVLHETAANQPPPPNTPPPQTRLGFSHEVGFRPM